MDDRIRETIAAVRAMAREDLADLAPGRRGDGPWSPNFGSPGIDVVKVSAALQS